MTEMTSTKPYLFRGIYEWIEDNRMTPYIVVDAAGDGVLVPQEYVNDGQITLNISSSSIELYTMDNKLLHFSARFNGLAQELTIPMHFILGIYARENGQGMFFEPEENLPEEPVESIKPVEAAKIETVTDEEPKKNTSKKSKKSKKSGSKRDNSHLKIIK